MTSGPVQLALQQEVLPTNTAIRLTSPGPALSRPVRVLHAAHTSAWSGAEIALVRLIGALDRRLVTSILVCAEDGRLADVARRQNVQTLIEPLSQSLRNRRRRQIRSISTLAHVPALGAYACRLARLAKAHQVDVIHTNSLKAFTYGVLAGRIAGVPVVAHLRDDLDHLEAGAAGRAIRSLLRRLPDAVIGCSAHVLTAARITSPRSHVVYTGISRENVADQAILRSGPPVVGMVARIAPWKGQHLFLRAAAEIAARRPDARFRIIGGPMFGEDGYLRELEDLATIEPLAGRVEFTGFVADPRTAYERLTVAVAASVAPEPFGKVIIEAMARGVPVVAPAEGGPTEIITHGVDGLLVPPRDPGALATAILRLLDSPGVAESIAGQALCTIRTRFTLEASAERFTGVLLGVVS